MSDWIFINERLPRKGKDVLVTNGVGIDIGWIDVDANEWRFSNDYIVDEVIAWMQLPKPPKSIITQKEN